MSHIRSLAGSTVDTLEPNFQKRHPLRLTSSPVTSLRRPEHCRVGRRSVIAERVRKSSVRASVATRPPSLGRMRAMEDPIWSRQHCAFWPGNRALRPPPRARSREVEPFVVPYPVDRDPFAEIVGDAKLVLRIGIALLSRAPHGTPQRLSSKCSRCE